MCVISDVMNNYINEFTEFLNPATFTPIGPPQYVFPPAATNITVSSLSKEDLDRLEKLIADFKEACKLAEKLDIIMKQPNCIDPEKEKLRERVAQLEAQIGAIKEISNQ